MVKLILACLLVVFLLLHSLRKRGKPFTWNLFFFLLFYLFSRAAHADFALSWLGLPPLLKPLGAAIFSYATVFVIFYLSLDIGEFVLNKANFFRSLFPLILISGLSCSFLAAFFAHIFAKSTLVNFFSSYPFKDQISWFNSTIHFLTAFLLINCSRFKFKEWKMLFVIFPLINIWLYRIPQTSILLNIEEAIFAFGIIILSLFFKIKYEPE